jgi:DNA gyrase subunit A
VGAIQIFSGDEVMLISDQGTLVRTRSEEVSVQGRNTQGVRLINLGGDEHLVGLARVEEPADDEDAMASDEDLTSAETSDTGTSDTDIVGQAGDDADSGHSPDDTDTQ